MQTRELSEDEDCDYISVSHDALRTASGVAPTRPGARHGASLLLNETMTIRPYRDSDLEVVVRCFERSVRGIAARYYAAAQIAAWTADARDPGRWRTRLQTGGVFVSELQDRIAGFVRVDDNGYVDLLYVDPEFERRGVGRGLLQVVHDWARNRGVTRLESEVSLAARPLFEAMGFRVETEQTVQRNGVSFRNLLMRCALAPEPAAGDRG